MEFIVFLVFVIAILFLIASLFVKLLPYLALLVIVLWVIRQFKKSKQSPKPKDDKVIDAQFEVHYDDEDDHSV